MPNFGLHVLLASRVADHWVRDPSTAPFDPSDPVSRNAFFHGCIGPDMGMYPGGDHLLSDLVHRIRSGQLTRSLLAMARTDAERAFAWGWLTHVLADHALHPVVNQVAAEALGWSEPRMQSREQMAAHVRVEMGLDAEYVGRDPFLRDVRLRPAFDARTVGLVQVALFETYGTWFDGSVILRSHRAVLRFHRHVLFVGLHTVRRWGRRGVSTLALRLTGPLVGALRSVTGVLSPSATSAFLDPMPPSPALRQRVDAVIEAFPETVRHYQATRLATLPDFDLETGGIEEPSAPTRSTARVLEALAERGLRVAGHTAPGEAA